MSDQGEKICPLCAEEMDLTDQQLKPCKCGYDICVWCWHHIMGMAEKDGTEGRCPACRTPYNKKKIVETSSKCERLVAEMSVEKKQKSQKGKSNTTSEGRKQLSSVRVIQRNLVYIVGLPLNLADEDLLQRKEYFGQYGKVLKVCISRTTTGAIQHFPNNTCSVYITYSKEDEAVRSIQSVHGFVLEGRPLRACFGTTKYCHAWLRSMPCTNPDCLYLHEFGSQEDSFTKDEIISEYTRGRVQQVTSATNEIQQRSGNILPPAADGYSNNNTSSCGKPIDKTTTNDSPNSCSGRSLTLPAAASWGTRTSKAKPDQPVSSKQVLPSSDKNESIDRVNQLSSDMSSVSIGANHVLQSSDDETPTEPLASNKENNAPNTTMDDNYVNEVEADLVSFNNQRLQDPEVVTHTHTHTNTHTGYVNNSHPFRNTFNLDGDKTALGLGENSIISNILSMDFDPWDESLTSPQNLAKLLGNNNNQGPEIVSGSRKTHNCNQSRFSFARQDDVCIDQGLNLIQNGFSSFNFEESDRTATSFSPLSSNKISVSRSQISPPPGFMGHNRAPPPGFTSNDNLSGNHMFDSSSLLRKVNQAPAAMYNNNSLNDLEFMDPAIMAVGGRVPHGGPGLYNDTRLRLLVQRSFTHQRFNDIGGDPYGVPTRFTEHNNRSAYQQMGGFQQSRMMSNNGHWNEVQNGNDMAMAELLRNERLVGFNKYYSGYEDAKFRVLSSGDVYNRTYGI